MRTIRQGSIHLGRVAGIDVYLHWSWFVAMAFMIAIRKGTYSSVAWNLLEYLSLFMIVLLHEFGHAMACRQVGGTANRIVLWPLGGVAYINPPQRPGATLWSTAAGPLVNVALLPVLVALAALSGWLGWVHTLPNAYHFLRAVMWIDFSLLVFNMLPIYPLDGGQIFQSLLWFAMGRGRSLLTTAILGLVGALGFVGLALDSRSIWLGIISGFMLMNCWSGLRQARDLLHIAKVPRREGFSCPSCRTAPPPGKYWKCRRCGLQFDTFQSQAVCPKCAAQFATTRCTDCGGSHPLREWTKSAFASGGLTAG